MSDKGVPKKNMPAYWWMPVTAIVLAFIAYTPSFQAGFVNWDDDDYVVKNHAIVDLGNLHRILTEPLQGNYHPVTMLSLAMNYAVSGLDPFSYHLVNLLIHLLNVLLVFLFVRRLAGDKPWMALLVALLFAIHPLHVESVAWISERKDVLYSCFFLAAMLTYLKYLKNGKFTYYILTFLLFTLSVLSKPAAVVFPIILLGIDWYRGRLQGTRVYLEKIPFFLLSVVFGVLTLKAQSSTGSISGSGQFAITTRLLFGSYGIMMYVIKTVWPLNLCTIYPYPLVNEPLPIAYKISPLFFIGLMALMIWSSRRNKIIPFAIFFYLVNLALVLQILPVGSAVIADRYSYLPLLGIFLVPGYYLQAAADARLPRLPVTGLSVLAVITCVLVVLCYRQASTWKDGESLWDQAIKVSPCSISYTNRGALYSKNNEPDKALDLFNKALQIDRAHGDALIHRGNISFNRQKYEEAVIDYSACLTLDSSNQVAMENRGAAYAALGRYNLALTDMNKSIALKPETENGYKNRAFLYQMLDSNEQAISDFYKQMEVNRTVSPDLLSSIGVSYIKMKEYHKALEVLTEAIDLNPQGAFFLKRGFVLFQLDRKDEAKADILKGQSLGAVPDQNFLKSIGQ